MRAEAAWVGAAWRRWCLAAAPPQRSGPHRPCRPRPVGALWVRTPPGSKLSQRGRPTHRACACAVVPSMDRELLGPPAPGDGREPDDPVVGARASAPAGMAIPAAAGAAVVREATHRCSPSRQRRGRPAMAPPWGPHQCQARTVTSQRSTALPARASVLLRLASARRARVRRPGAPAVVAAPAGCPQTPSVRVLTATARLGAALPRAEVGRAWGRERSSLPTEPPVTDPPPEARVRRRRPCCTRRLRQS
jgi:hypothetical protein